jgi:hypothetical protein
MFSGAKELKVVFFQCDWFDPINGTRVDDFSLVEVPLELMTSIWWRSSMNHAIQGAIFCLHIMRNRCTT